MSDEPEVRRGLVAAELAAEHPGLWLAWTDVAATPGPTPAASCASGCADWPTACTAPQAIALRQREVPHAYRVFFRHVGLDPDVVRTPVEAVALRRMTEGGLRPRGLIDDALTVAVLETGVGVVAFDADAPGRRAAAARRRRDDRRRRRRGHRSRVAVRRAGAARAAVTARTRRSPSSRSPSRTSPTLFVEEALWIAWDILRA